jgi:HSP20 family molecular chaperone IbpA
MKMEDVEVTYEKDVLWIKAEKKEEEKRPDKKFYRRALQSYSYRIALPASVDEKKILKRLFKMEL